jgi:hypothetical protein
MGSSVDNRITVNVLSAAGPVTTKEFRLGCYGSNTISFTGGDLYRIYESINDVNDDTDVTGQPLLAAQKFFAQEKRPPRFMIGAVVDEVASGELPASLTAIKDQIDFYHLELESKVKLQIETAAAWVETNEGQGWFQSSDADFLAGTALNIGEVLQTAGYKRSHVIYHETDTDEVQVGLSANFFFTDPDTGSTTASDQTSVGSAADDITSTEKNNVLGVNANVYLPFGDGPVMSEGTMADGGWIDYILTSDWLENRSQVALIQAIKDAVALGGKISYTDKGIAILEGAAGAVMETGVSAGSIEAGTWSITVPKVADVSAATRQSRGLTMSATAYTTGAVQEITYTIYLLEG